MSEEKPIELGLEDAVKLLTDEGYIKWCQSKPLDAGDYKGNDDKD